MPELLSRDLKILIVGAGPVGLTAAIELSRHGFRPRLVEKNTAPAPLAESRALAINPRTLQLLEPSGVTQKLLAEAFQIRQLRLNAGGRRLMTIDTMQVPGKYRGMHALRQSRTERILLDRLAEAGIAPEWRTELFSLAHNGGSVAASLRGPHGEETAELDLVIGADGAHSAVRKAAGLKFPGEALIETFYLADYRYPSPVATDFVEAHLFDPGLLARLPVDERTVRYVSTLADFRDRIDHPAAVESLVWASEFRVSYRHVEPMAAGGVFLAGDAAHIHSPVGGRGMNLGIEDACWLAWLIAERREAEYSALRLPAVRRVLAGTGAMTRLILMRGAAASLRNLAAPLLARIPFLRRGQMRAVLGLDTPLPPWLDPSTTR